MARTSPNTIVILEAYEALGREKATISDIRKYLGKKGISFSYSKIEGILHNYRLKHAYSNNIGGKREIPQEKRQAIIGLCSECKGNHIEASYKLSLRGLCYSPKTIMGVWIRAGLVERRKDNGLRLRVQTGRTEQE